ncbi:MAG TPA: hypothetical protein VHU77_03980 [Candidatus Limnocylindria bacterium]|nr:hypothetical protein [Candidatus Limnocylindria bacterium]
MRRFRTQWLAAFGALVVLSFSLSTAFGARPSPAADESASFGQQVSTFVHVVLSGTSNEDESSGDETGDDTGDETGDETGDTTGDECQTSDDDGSTDEDSGADEGSGDTTGDESGDTTGDESGDQDEDTGDTTGDETGDQDEDTGDTTGDESGDTCDEQSDEGTDEGSDEDSGDDSGSEDSGAPTAQNHGQCVAEVAHSDAVGDNGTHGWAVMLAAQVTCLLQEATNTSADTGDESAGSGDENSGTDETSNTSTRDHPHGKSDAAHQRKLDGGHGKPSWASTKSHGNVHGNGHGKGHGHSA